MTPPSPMPERSGEVVIWLIVAFVALFVGTTRMLHQIGPARPWVRALANLMVSLSAGIVGGALHVHYIGREAPLLIVSVALSCWAGGDLLTRAAQLWLNKWTPKIPQ